MSRPVGFCLLLAALLGLASVQFSVSAIGPSNDVPIDLSRPGPLSRDDSVAPFEGIPPVRVLLEPTAGRTISIHIDGPYRVTPLDSWRVLAQGEALNAADVAVFEGGIRVGLREFSQNGIEVEVVESGTLWVGRTRYRGSLWLVRRPGDRVAAINVVDLEDYVESVVASETPEDFPDAAREAQAIAARSFAIYQVKAFGKSGDFDVRDSSSSQRYLGVEQEADDGSRLRKVTDGSHRATAATRGIVVVYRGRLMPTFYSAVCGGRTNPGKAIFSATWPPLVGVDCPDCSSAPHYRWEEVLDWGELRPKLIDFLNRRGLDLGELERVEVFTPVGAAVPSVRIVGTKGNYDISAHDFRLRIAGAGRLLSPNFLLKTDRAKLHFRGNGWGHGVGMCQWGARGRALEGESCAKILAYYYPGTQLVYVR